MASATAMVEQMVRGVVVMGSSKWLVVVVLTPTTSLVDTNIEEVFGGPWCPENDVGPETAGWGSDLRPERRCSRKTLDQTGLLLPLRAFAIPRTIRPYRPLEVMSATV